MLGNVKVCMRKGLGRIELLTVGRKSGIDSLLHPSNPNPFRTSLLMS